MSVLTTSVPLTNSDEKIIKVLCIFYPIWFQEEQIKALLDSGSKVNAINPNFARKRGFKIQKTNVKAQKIDSFALEIF